MAMLFPLRDMSFGELSVSASIHCFCAALQVWNWQTHGNLQATLFYWVRGMPLKFTGVIYLHSSICMSSFGLHFFYICSPCLYQIITVEMQGCMAVGGKFHCFGCCHFPFFRPQQNLSVVKRSKTMCYTFCVWSENRHRTEYSTK